jgi:NAD-dependent SIR2 family protein deacetylase
MVVVIALHSEGESIGPPDFSAEYQHIANSRPMAIEDRITEAAAAVEDADALLIMAGAGMGVDSGLPDFRGNAGFWRAYPVLANLGLSFEKMANPEWFRKSPELAWAFYGQRLNLYRQTAPHPGFRQLLEIGARKPMGYFVFTSNVDGQFQKAGFATDRIAECHGSIHHFQCPRPCGWEIWDASTEIVALDEVAFRARAPLPKCRNCDVIARPNVLMFGDGAWIGSRSQTQQGLFNDWITKVHKSSAKLVVMEMGAGVGIPTVRHLSERAVERVGGRLVRINLRDDAVPSGQISLRLGAAEGIRRIYEAIGSN